MAIRDIYKNALDKVLSGVLSSEDMLDLLDEHFNMYKQRCVTLEKSLLNLESTNKSNIKQDEFRISQ